MQGHGKGDDMSTEEDPRMVVGADWGFGPDRTVHGVLTREGYLKLEWETANYLESYFERLRAPRPGHPGGGRAARRRGKRYVAKRRRRP